MPEAPSDFDLLDAWRGGDTEAANALFKRHFESLFRFFHTKIDGPVDDLVQDTFLGCVQGRNRFRGESKFRTYMLSIARNVLYDHYRDARRTPDFTTSSAVDLGASPSRQLSAKRDRAKLLAALRTIPLEFQVTLELYYWQGLKGDEVAGVLDVSPNTVRSRLARARDQLRGALERLDAGRGDDIETDPDLDAWARSVLA